MLKMKSLNGNRSNEDLRRYLLGTLPKLLQDQVEQRLMTDSVFNDELVATEDDLIDQYLSQQLSDQERRQFEAHFAISEERQRKIRFGRIFRRYLDSLPTADQEEHQRTNRARMGGNSSDRFAVFGAWSGRIPVLVASLVIALFAGTLAAWFVYQRQSRVEGQLVVITLVPGSLRSLGATTQRLKQPPPNSTVQIQLKLTANEYRTYQVELFNENKLVSTSTPLQAQNSEGYLILKFAVDSDLLSVGDYQCKLSGISDSGQTEFKDSYGFRVNP
jgi:hypothetical protein